MAISSDPPNPGSPAASASLDLPRPNAASRLRLAFIRGIIWSLHGMIYAPLFAGLSALLKELGFGGSTYAIAAAVTGAVTAVLYGARELSLISSAIGAAVGVILLIVLTGPSAFVYAALGAAAIAATVGLIVRFPTRCSMNVASKALAGLAAGAVGGTILALAEPFHAAPFSLFVVLAFLVSINGVLYVASLRRWVALTHRFCQTAFPCNLVEAAIMAILAGVAAGSVWMVSGPLTNIDPELWWQAASLGMHQQIPQAVLGGLFGGGIAGILLQIFRFSWVDDL
ncbi:hypothetical protein [uncultured Thiocystis sp.]|jgi:hypothetical protein|uniref:hypothetical protein n=1 Tax=uncultured Thiocystis sp. TaxID=1202134 RepID=UPI0025D491B9|nr:hypothetical protein [uncultured Thiocystis sp.]